MKSNRSWVMVAVTAASVLVVVVWRLGGLAGNSPTTGPAAPNAERNSRVRHTRLETENRLRAHSGLATAVEANVPHQSAHAQVIHQFATGLEAIAAESDGSERGNRLAGLIGGLATGDLPAALGFIEAQSTSELNDDTRWRLIQRWTSENPQAVAEWADGKPAGPKRQEAINTVAIAWANQDLTEVAKWVRQLPGDQERQEAMLNVAYETVRGDPIQGLQLAAELPADAARNELVRRLSREWAVKAPQAAADWAGKMPDADLREHLLADVAAAWGATDPVAAAVLSVNSLKPGRLQDDSVVGIVQSWVQQNPAAAAAWVTQFPEGTLRNTAVEQLVRLWAGQDPQRAGNWLNAMEDAPIRDIALGAYAGAIAPQYPQAAAEWANAIADEFMRHRQIERVAEFWLASDATLARDWIARASLSDEQKLKLLGTKTE